MRFKQILSALLVSSLVLPAALPSMSYAQEGSSSGLTSSANDAIDMILQAMTAKTPAEAHALLAKAQEKAIAEKLPPETLAKIVDLINEAEKKLKLAANDQLAGLAPMAPSLNAKTTPLTSTANPKTPDVDAVVAKLMAENPDLHSTILQISIGRLKRDSANLDEIVKSSTGQSIAASDAAEALVAASLGDAGAFIKALRKMGLIGNSAEQNKALREKNESVSVDTLARHIIDRACQSSVLAGAVRKLANATGTSKTGAFAGVSAEAIGSFIVNANLVLQLADLYGMNLNESQQDVMILAVLPLAKLFTVIARNQIVVQRTAAQMGDLFAEVKANPNPSALTKFYAAVFASPLMASLAKRMGLGAQLEATKSKLGSGVGAKAPAGPAAAEAGAAAHAAPAVGGIEAAVAKMEAGAAAVEQKVAPMAEKAVGIAEKAEAAPLNWKAQAAWLVTSMVVSGAETYATGRVAMWWFAREKEKSRQIETKNFHSFLMSDQGRGFFKLLIATMNFSPSPTRAPVIDVRTSNDPRATFIMNIARSVRICSPADSARFKQIQAQQKAGLVKILNLVDRDYQLLRFECGSTLGFGRYNQLVKEFMTLNSIPEWEVASLRTASYSSRVQMLELIMQLQFLDGEPNDEQIQFLQTTVMKILGLTRLEDLNYKTRLYAFIRERGGMVPNISSPTGWMIRPDQNDDPYSDGINYTIAGAPEMPSPPAIALVTPTASGTAGPAKPTTTTVPPAPSTAQPPTVSPIDPSIGETIPR